MTHASFLNRRSLMTLMASALVAPMAAASPAPRILATTGMIADAARRLTGLEVTALMGPGMDPHGYRQTRSDIAAMARADLVLWHGLYLEAQMEDFLTELARNRPVVAVADALPKQMLRAHDIYPDRYDPHVWMDPTLWADLVDIIAATLGKTFPALADKAQTEAAAMRADITGLQTYAQQVLASVPAERRLLVTAHDAFGYFGRAYGFEVQGIQGLSTESEAGLARVTELVDLLVDRKIPAVFVETSVSDRSIRALIEGAAAQGHEVRIGGALYSDAMGPDGTYEGTWLGMIDHNVTTIARALGGAAPERGRMDQLAQVAG